MPEQTRAATDVLTAADLEWLTELMDVDSVSPLEGGPLDGSADAQRVFLAGARERGFRTAWHEPPAPEILERPEVPAPVRDAARRDLAGFLAGQPSAVVALGTPAPEQRRLVVNFHVDTVGPHVAPHLEGRILHGRGAVDDKGPGIAAAVGVAAAFADDPGLAGRIEVQLASVAGEEGGAMGTYGTRALIDAGFTGRLMVFAEPTGNRFMDACTTAMTPRITVRGEDSTDDHPGEGHNATVLLGFLADFLARKLGPLAHGMGAKLCVSGLHTGHAHNRVYGGGQLLLNIAYPATEQAELLAASLEVLLEEARTEFGHLHAHDPFSRRTVRDWRRIVRLDWLKRGLPTLSNRDPDAELLLTDAGFSRHDALADGSAFTCDAIWAPAPGRYVAVCGPGRLDTNGAHTPGEHVHLDDLNDYARRIKNLVHIFAARTA
ncbi:MULTISPECIES: M20/M25/M40 family metallo-hydrolase [unclassified Streptomyces]|uniref:M20/M25/M40 family metallo-hydrolase n=1 Tax=unclassified Streptomyces TaxID=2593676 RepID=UPI00278C8BCA|nr:MULTISPECIES: M20/M25/M40 family metallo-hydrolase [unclassified Streptomyces]